MSTVADPVLPSPLEASLREIHARHASLRDGQVATYIPELSKANPDWFGICLVTTGGHVYEVGDSRQRFTIQSISKPFVYGLALEDNTRAEVLKRIGVEPTGDAFNAISLEAGTGRPRNPMINAGAIAAAGLIAGKSPQSRYRRMLEMFSRYLGEEVAIDEAVYRSESETGHRNRAIGHMLRNFDILVDAPDPVVDLYFRQCSVAVNCRDLAMMAATLANRGVNPVTGKQALRGEYVESVLSVMGSCGMYDYAGEWLYRIGMPAKSGVSGGVLAVLPGQLGIGVFSPPLDPRGNSVRGLAVCNDLSRHFDLHLFNSPHASQSVIRLRFSAARMNSSRYRTQAESEALQKHGDTLQVFQLQGDLALSTAEVLLHEILSAEDDLQAVVIDFKHVLSINECACRLLAQLLLRFADRGRRILFSSVSRVPLLRRYLKTRLEARFETLYLGFENHDAALEWCENRFLAERLPGHLAEQAVPPADYELFEGLSPEELAVVTPLLKRRSGRAGEVIVHAGDTAGELFLIARGSVSATVQLSSGQPRRLAAYSAGMTFGEMAFLDQAPRSAVVVADTDFECDLLSQADFVGLEDRHPRLRVRLLHNLALCLSRRLRKANREISVFDY